VALTALVLNQSASWWIGTLSMLPFVLFGGSLIVRKIRRSDLVWSFLAVALIFIVWFGFQRGGSPLTVLTKALADSPILFFAFIMLTEPLTVPPTKLLRVVYGAFTGLLFVPSVHIGSIYSTPELALLVGNIFSYLVSPKEKLFLTLNKIDQAASDVYDFMFTSDAKLKFKPGQYLEWTLAHPRSDSRGNRRYFTIASSPTEKSIRMGVKFYPDASSFKRRLGSMQIGNKIIASQLAGDFTLPKNTEQKLAFIAGGIGITPFRSMIKYMLDTNQRRPIVMIYSNKTSADIAYKEIFDQAEKQLEIKTIYAMTGESAQGRDGFVGKVDGQTIEREIPDFMERAFYLSGPNSMVVAFEEILKKLGVKKSHIKKDYFPGFA